MTADEIPPEPPAHEQLDGALMLSFGAVHPGRERLAIELFTEMVRYLGRLFSAGLLSSFKPYFFADGLLGDISGFFLVEGRRSRLDDLRRDPEFVRMVLRVGGATANVRVSTLIAGAEAGRLVNLYRDVRDELGLLR